MNEALRRGLQGPVASAPNPTWAARTLERLAEENDALSRLPSASLTNLARVAGSSPLVGNWLTQEPGLLGIFEANDLGLELSLAEYAARLAAPAEAPESSDLFRRRVRRVRRREILRIIAREALGLAPVEVTSRELSALAEAAIDAALGWADSRLAEAHGELQGEDGCPNQVCALGLGKLGGNELNLSSDVDLLFIYRSARGKSTGGKAGDLEPRSYVSQLVRLVADVLGRVTEDGVVFRVDLDLRPEGRNGELAQPLDNAVLYYQSWGQTWERAALMKARPVAGSRELGRLFLGEVEPFVFRRTLDYTTVEDIAEMKRQIDLQGQRRGAGTDDIKTGRGGIREVEFFVQTLQLVHGGKRPGVRSRNTLDALERLASAGVAEPQIAQGLGRCYRFLRSLEHGIQALHLRQTHRLPVSSEERQAVARRLGFAGESPTDELAATLESVRAEVHGAYGRLAHGAARQWEGEPGSIEARALLALDPREPGTEVRLKEAGFGHPGRAVEALRLLQRGPARGHPSPRARKILDRLAPFLLNAALRAPNPDRALLGIAEFLAGSGARASYLSLLEENPPTARLLMTLFGTSGFLSRYLLGHPELLDELVLQGHGVRRKTRGELGMGLSVAIRRCRDEEERLDALRHFRNAEFLRIALNDLWGELEPEEVSRQITFVAEVCLEEACRDALTRLIDKYGPPLEESGDPARFAVLGLGKLGGAELDYYSDLDVLFLYSAAGFTRPPPGGRALTNGEFFSRLAQRLIGILTVRTREGVAFRMDARLRPSGQAGPLVTSLAAFTAYHEGGGGQTWETQALLRLRPVAGDPVLGTAAAAVVQRLIFREAPGEDPRPEIDRMRTRIEVEVGREAGGQIDLKAGPGGIVDVEFVVQCLQLIHGWRDGALQSPNTLDALVGLRNCGILTEEDGDALVRGYQFLRRVEARLRILQERPTDRLPAGGERLAELARGLGYGKGGAGALRDDVRRHRQRVRQAYTRTLRGGHW
jgi:glutamate-ammonia-ligase adenylyltransferase